MRAPLLGLAVLLATFSCRGATQLRVVVRSDVPFRDGMAVAIWASASGAWEGTPPLASTREAWIAGTPIGELIVTPRSSREERVTIQVALGIGRDPSTCTKSDPHDCILETRVVSFQPYESQTVDVVLHGSCVGVVCGEGAACSATGQCVVGPSENVSKDAATDVDPGEGDATASLDASATDATDTGTRDGAVTQTSDAGDAAPDAGTCPGTFGTWDDDRRWSEITLDGTRLEATVSDVANQWGSVFGTVGKQRGKWYYELTTNVAGTGGIAFGIGSRYGQASSTGSVYACAFNPPYNYRAIVCLGYPNVTTSVPEPVSGDILHVAADLDAQKVYLGRNGAWMAGGNPAAGTGGTRFLKTRDEKISPWVLMRERGSRVTANFGQRAFTYAVPSGFTGGWYDDCSADTPTYPSPGGVTCPGSTSTAYTYEKPSAAGPDVHVLAQGDNGTVTVNVTGVARPVVLVLIQHHFVTWNITAAPGATIQQVYVAVGGTPTVNVPMGVPVTNGPSSPYSGAFPSQVGSAIVGKWAQDTFGVTPHTGRSCGSFSTTFTIASIPVP